MSFLKALEISSNASSVLQSSHFRNPISENTLPLASMLGLYITSGSVCCAYLQVSKSSVSLSLRDLIWKSNSIPRDALSLHIFL